VAGPEGDKKMHLSSPAYSIFSSVKYRQSLAYLIFLLIIRAYVRQIVTTGDDFSRNAQKAFGDRAPSGPAGGLFSAP